MRAVVALGLVGVGLLAGSAFAASSNDAPAQQMVARGRYIATAADCVSCHTAPGAAAYSGGAALKTPFGEIYAPNITPDPATGIGAWSEAEFARALREGVRKDGKPLYPAMPYTSYTLMSDGDVAAVYAYLRSVPPVTRRAPANTLVFPFNVRSGLGAWQAAFFDPGRFTPDQQKDAAWNRGAYLVDALGHCGACHTPRNVAMASVPGRSLTGARIEGWYAPDISNDPLSALSGMSVDALAEFLRTGRTRGNANAFGTMGQVVHESLARLSSDDLLAMATYLKDQPVREHAPPAKAPRPDAQRLAAGLAIYTEQCASCHRADGKGVAGGVPALAGNAAVTAREPYNVISAVLEGLPANGTWGAMPSFAGTLGDDDIALVANYVRDAWGAAPGVPATSWMVGRLRPTADVPAGDRAAQACPTLPDDQLAPALAPGHRALLQSAQQAGSLATLVHAYERARPGASSAQIVGAMSTAYCRAVADGGATRPAAGAGMARYAEQVARVLAAAPHPAAKLPR